MVNDSEVNSSFSLFGPFGIAYFDGDGDEASLIDATTNTVKIILSLLMGVSMILSVIGNVCTCTVIAQDRTMRTPINCYLANLAITDLLVSLFIPIDIYIIWTPDFYPLGEVGCRLHFIILDSLSNCSLLIITAFTIERYIVIKKPFLRQKMLVNSRVFKIVGIIWVTSIVLCLPDIFYIDLLERKKYVFCYYTLTYYVPTILLGLEMFIFFIIPMTILIVLYTLIILELKSEQNKLRSGPVNARQNRDKAVKILAAVATSFFFFWSPYCILRIMIMYPNFNYEDNSTAWKIVNYLCYNGYLSTAVNPILYSIMSRKFRQAFKDVLKGSRTRRPPERRRSMLQECKIENTSTSRT